MTNPLVAPAFMVFPEKDATRFRPRFANGLGGRETNSHDQLKHHDCIVAGGLFFLFDERPATRPIQKLLRAPGDRQCLTGFGLVAASGKYDHNAASKPRNYFGDDSLECGPGCQPK